jgi:hypothetical protein
MSLPRSQLCPVGTYSTEAGATECLSCGGGVLFAKEAKSVPASYNPALNFYCPPGSVTPLNKEAWQYELIPFLPDFEASSSIEVFEEVREAARDNERVDGGGRAKGELARPSYEVLIDSFPLPLSPFLSLPLCRYWSPPPSPVSVRR